MQWPMGMGGIRQHSSLKKTNYLAKKTPSTKEKWIAAIPGAFLGAWIGPGFFLTPDFTVATWGIAATICGVIGAILSSSLSA